MAELIPLLRDLAEPRFVDIVPPKFVDSFVRLHEDNWNLAEEHWEYLVSAVLNTDAVDPDATRRRAINQAVSGAITLLERTDLHERCPECVTKRRRWFWRWRR